MTTLSNCAVQSAMFYFILHSSPCSATSRAGL